MSETKIQRAKLKVELEGTKPLIMHSARGLDPTDPLVKELKGITGKRQKTEDDYMRIAELEYKLGLWY